MDAKLVWLTLAVVIIVIFFYMVLPKLNLGHKSGIMFRTIIFGAMMSYLTYDFIQKEKYSYLIVIVLGIIGFVLMVTNMKSKK
ncbi:MAG: hypothetical protein ACK4XL_09910 [Bacteroidota bacterium]|jgi:hypothetical protein